MVTKRGHGEGSIRQRRPGQWEQRITLPDGHRRSAYGETKKGAQEKGRELVRAFDAGLTTLDRTQTVETYLKRWLADAAKPTLRPKTWDNYESMLRVHVLPLIGKVKLASLTAQQLQAVYSRMLTAGKSPRTAQLAHAVVHKAFKQAVLWALIPSNPADRVVAPKPVRREFSTLRPSHVRALLDGSGDPQWRALLLLAVSTGLRQGEQLGLEWPDVDLDRGTLSVRRSLGFQRGRGLVTTDVKTARSRRTVELGAALVGALRVHRTAQLERRLRAGPAWVDLGFVFTRDDGQPLEPGSVTHRFQRESAELGLPVVRYHDLRHTAATLMLEAGIHPKVVQERLGHATIAVTMDTYSHVLPNMQRDAAAAMDRVLAAAGA